LLQFLNPIWLAAGAGIIIPVAIHLWNVRKGKVLRIGSTLLMSDATQQSSSSLRLTQWLLLLIRCLMIILLAMLMAGPEWKVNKEKTQNGWVLIDKKDFSFVYSQFKSPIDSLLNKGFELHAADESFEKINIADSSQFVVDTNSLTKLSLSYWSILRRADRSLPAGYPVYFFSNNKLTDAAGTIASRRPVISIDLRWQMAQKDTVFPNLPVIARQLNSGGYELASFQPGNNGNHFSRSSSSVPFSRSASLVAPVNVPRTDTATILVSIYHNKFSEDLRYLQAAIRAIAGFGDYKLLLTTVDKMKEIPASRHWLFWLSNELPPANLSTENLFLYQPGTAVVTKSWLTTDNGVVDPGAINIFQRVAGSAEQRKLIWKDGFGNPLLTLEDGAGSNPGTATDTRNESNRKNDTGGNNGNAVGTAKAVQTGDAAQTGNTYKAGLAQTSQHVYRFYSRFHPAWSDLSWNPDFPKLLFPLIIGDPAKDIVTIYNENRTEAADVMPTVIRQTYKENKSAFKVVELSNTFWLITFLLFAAERIVSMNRRNTKQTQSM
jgi:hypothetical protein